MSCLANLSNLSSSERNILRKLPDKGSLNGSDAGLRLVHFIKAEKPYFSPIIEPDDLSSVVFVKAKQSNRRILAQQGAFLLFGLVQELEPDNDFRIDVHQIVIGPGAKVGILAELDRISINDSTLFPEIETAARYIMNKLAPDL